MTQYLLSGNAENVDWNDIAEAGRAYADNLLGEPAVSKVMHAMADEIERLRNMLERREQPQNTQDQRLATADETTPADGIASPLHPMVMASVGGER